MKEPSLVQALLDAIAGTLDTSTQIADHPNVKFAQMRRLDLVARAEKAEALYQELLYAVESKHPNETRHQTALRYIRQAETPSGECASDSTALTDS